MLHDRFYSEWAQPSTTLTAGAKVSALVKVRIEKDGRVTSFEIVRSSGNPVVDDSIKEWESFQKRLEKTNKELKAFAKKAPVAEQEAREVLNSVPGVGTVTVDVVVSELGDVRRFRSQKKVVAYAGLAPGYRETGGKRKQLRITKEGSPLLRWVLVEAAWRLVRFSPRWKNSFENLRNRCGKKRAIVAIARRLFGVMAALLKKGEKYRLAS